MSQLQQCLRSSYIIPVIVTMIFISPPVSSNKIVDLISSVRDRTSDEQRPKESIVTELRDILQTIQEHMYNTSFPVCLPGFYSYAGACYLLSPLKSSWDRGASMCSQFRNSTLVTFDTNEELDFVVHHLMKPREINQAFIGLHASNVSQWMWLDGRTFWDSIFGPLFYVYRPETSRCGLINLVNRSQVAIEGRDCTTDEAHSLCKYVQNHCYAKDVCGGGGECLNIGLTYRCQCNFFYQGRRCQKLSSKAIQSLIALVIIALLALAGCFFQLNIFAHCHSSQDRDLPVQQFFNDQDISREQRRRAPLRQWLVEA